MNDLLIWDMYFNVNNWFTVDFLRAGLPNVLAGQGGNLVDRFSAFTLKSLPFRDQVGASEYLAGGGIKFYGASFSVSDSTQDTLVSSEDGSLVAFVTQGLTWRERHYFNLFISLSGRTQKLSTGDNKIKSTYYLVPGYRLELSKNWRAGLEHYMTNTEYLPIKALQWAFDEDQLEFYNAERYMYSFMVWGFQYAREHFYFSLTLANHISFQGPILPLLGAGWNF
jgi:hypothetical protein